LRRREVFAASQDTEASSVLQEGWAGVPDRLAKKVGALQKMMVKQYDDAAMAFRPNRIVI
jgi:hypothetical protein